LLWRIPTQQFFFFSGTFAGSTSLIFGGAFFICRRVRAAGRRDAHSAAAAR
jgi:hypothetical protein